jgi:hypothetical protein
MFGEVWGACAQSLSPRKVSPPAYCFSRTTRNPRCRKRFHRWLYANKEAAIDFLAKEIPLKPDLARKGWEYYTANRIWHPNAEISPEGLKFTMEIYAEQTKSPPPDPLKYIDMSYLQQAIKELGEK